MFSSDHPSEAAHHTSAQLLSTATWETCLKVCETGPIATHPFHLGVLVSWKPLTLNDGRGQWPAHFMSDLSLLFGGVESLSP